MQECKNNEIDDENDIGYVIKELISAFLKQIQICQERERQKKNKQVFTDTVNVVIPENDRIHEIIQNDPDASCQNTYTHVPESKRPARLYTLHKADKENNKAENDQ